jgi:all-trans-8'-apo-beta-carotenal 15,15'-oxygenase
MWHSLNAYERDNTIVADFIGYDAPDHFFGADAAFRAIMQGRAGVARSAGKLRRITVDLSQRSARLETLIDAHLEFPVTNPRVQGQPYRFGYSAVGDISNGWFHDGVAQLDTISARFKEFRFGSSSYVGEPIFVARADRTDEEGGWLMCEVLDGKSGNSFLAILDAADVPSGPVARIRLRHHLPFSFHGWWEAA